MWTYFDKEGVEITKEDYLQKFENKEYKRINYNLMPNGLVISTVWLGLEHGRSEDGKPLIFETMVFPSESDFYHLFGQRYATLEEAKKGHEQFVVELAQCRIGTM